MLKEPDNWLPVALDAARAELQRRGIADIAKTPEIDLPCQPAESDKLQYEGVDGWLVLFCIILTILTPIRDLFRDFVLYSLYDEYSPSFTRYPGLRHLILIEVILQLVFLIYSVYVGIRLWRIRPGAVQSAKSYLTWNLSISAIIIILPFGLVLPPLVKEATVSHMVRGFLNTILWFTVWYSYLNVSKRVRATYRS